MKTGFYPRLALDSIRKNKRFYFPYILTGIGMVMMFYIIHYLASMPSLKDMAGGDTMTLVLGFGFWVVAIFAVIFLFYTNSFLMRRRQKEFGLYNILGMGKRSLGILLFWEKLILAVLSIVGGLAIGVLLSKMAELCLINSMEGAINDRLHIDPIALFDTWVVFSAIFALIFLTDLIKIRRLSAISLMKSESVGEKPPKANYLFGIVGILLLAAAYAIALSIDNPIFAVSWFFIAVVLVMLGTYLLFISGSVMLCRLFQKSKRYYYKPNHFVSVSSMAYRMKRNGAGLASICILSTMVLVIMMGAGSLYFGKEDSLRKQYPYEIALNVDYLSAGERSEYTAQKDEFLTEKMDALLQRRGVQPQNATRYISASTVALLEDGRLTLDPEKVNAIDLKTVDGVRGIHLIPLSAYNRCMGTQEVLSENEVLIYCNRKLRYDYPTVTLNDATVWTVKKQVDRMIGNGDADVLVIPSMFIVVADIESAVDCLNLGLGNLSEEELCRINWYYAFDTTLSAQEQSRLSDDIFEQVSELSVSGEAGFYSYGVDCRVEEQSEFYALFGGIFFLGLFLSLLFIAATVLIIYYKQITEGYEDEARFDIMRKVGMTKTDIRKSINSQMLTVFFLPLITAAVHTAFAFPIVEKLLMMFGLYNTALSLAVTAAAVVVFGVFYAVVYRITSNAYYAVVSGKREQV